MDVELSLPLPPEQLPAAIQKFCNPDAPTPAKMMAAKGLVPVRGDDQIIMLAQLGASPEEDVRGTAVQTMLALPEAVLEAACSTALPTPVLHFLADQIRNETLLGTLVANNATADATVERVAARATERLCERIAVNETRLLRYPLIIESLYKNRNARMSTADRLVELAARHGLELTGIPAFRAHVEALQGQLIPEASEEALPQDQAFAKSLEEDTDEIPFEQDKVDRSEEVKKKFKPLAMQIQEMSKAEKIRLCFVGNAAARSILVRDRNKQIAFSAVSSPQLTVAEAVEISKSKEVSDEILRYIGNRKEFMKSHELKHALVFNPKTPVGISMRFLAHMRINDLRSLAKSRNVPAQLKSIAASKVAQKEKK